jgi:hypothetical protein
MSRAYGDGLDGSASWGRIALVLSERDEHQRLLRPDLLDLVGLRLAEVEPEFVSWR